MEAERELYITGLHAKSIRNFNEINVEFNPKFNFITGPNASGKTSILRCLSMCVSSSELQDSTFGEDAEVWTDFTKDGDFYRLGYSKGWVRSNGYRNSQQIAWSLPPLVEGRESIKAEINQIHRVPEFAPLFIGAFRRLQYVSIAGMTKEPPLETKRNYYRDMAPLNLNGSVLPNIKQWMINRYFEMDKEWALYEKINWSWLIDHLSVITPKGVNLKFVAILKDLEPIFDINGNHCFLEELSAGFQSILSIIFSIFDWIESTNVGEGKRVSTAVGTVIIDELDAHLHPEWQLTIRDSFELLFPTLQFIITTHSPHLIASANSGEIIALSGDPKDMYNIKPSDRSYSGWNTDQILEEIMDVKSLENKDYGKMVQQGIQIVSEKKIGALKEFIAEFEHLAHPEDTVLAAFKIKLAELTLKSEE